MNTKISPNGIWAVIPVKRFDQAKTRLSPTLTVDQRHHLCKQMLADVLEAAINADNLAGVLVVTCDPEAIELAKEYNAQVLLETTSIGMLGAIDAASIYLKNQNCTGMMIIPGDVPLVQSHDIERIVTAHITANCASPAVTLVPAWDGGGTNAMVSSPPDVIEFCFGLGSFDAHKNTALSAGLEPTIIKSPGLELDIDTPDDITAFIDQGSHTRAAQYLVSIFGSTPLKRGLG